MDRLEKISLGQMVQGKNGEISESNNFGEINNKSVGQIVTLDTNS